MNRTEVLQDGAVFYVWAPTDTKTRGAAIKVIAPRFLRESLEWLDGQAKDREPKKAKAARKWFLNEYCKGRNINPTFI